MTGAGGPVSGATTALDCALLEDGTLRITADVGTEAQVRYWLPRLPAGSADPGRARASIEVHLGDVVASRPETAPDMALDPVEGWVQGVGTVTLRARDGSVGGTVDFVSLKATLALTPDAARPVATPLEPRNAAVFSALTLASALLLNRMRRALLHAAAVVAPDGRAWLLVGDAFAGKTTTTVNLIRAGWGWVSDDAVVLGRANDGAVVVEGWPRAFHLDRGYHAGESTGARIAVDPESFGPGQWRRGARLAGVVFPRVEADRPTAATPLPAADALARLIRQSPWLLADRTVARDVLALLTAAVSGPRFHLRLGRDAYRDTGRLLDALAAAGVR
jgi:hypothetical protein